MKIDAQQMCGLFGCFGFDHPQIFVPNGHPGDENAVTQLNGRAVDTFLEVPATGKNGGPVLPGFLE